MKDIRFYLDGVFSAANTFPSQVKIFLPVWDRVWDASGADVLCGLLTAEPTFSTQNRWGPVINDVSMLSDFSQLLSQNEIYSWIGASTQCWKSTDPLRFNVEMYLINYRRNLHLEERIRSLIKLTSIGQAHGGNADFKVAVHGGYMAEAFKSNVEMFENLPTDRRDPDTEKQRKLNEERDKNFGGTGKLIFNNPNNSIGTVAVQIGHSKLISNLLISRVDVTPSILEVSGRDGGKPKPLYYKVSVGFTGARAMLTTDVDRMF